MTDAEHSEQHRRELKQWRNPQRPDHSMAFVKKMFRQQIEKPYKQLRGLTELWQGLIPESMQKHARLESLQRGVLRVAVDSSNHLYELDRLLRDGLEEQLIRQHRGTPFRRIQLRVAPLDESMTAGPAAFNTGSDTIDGNAKSTV